MTWTVKQTTGFLTAAVYGPFTNEAEARRFAAFVTDEIAPAYVDYLHPDTVVDLTSPVAALLDWRDNIAHKARTTEPSANDAPPAAAMRCPHRDFDDPTYCPCSGGARRALLDGPGLTPAQEAAATNRLLRDLKAGAGGAPPAPVTNTSNSQSRGEVSAVSTTPVQELRRAAVRLRELAARATPGPWEHVSTGAGEGRPRWILGAPTEPGDAWSAADVIAITDDMVAALQDITEPDRIISDGDMDWIATVGPQIAPPLAEWLEDTADWLEQWDTEPSDDHPALILARAINGGTS